MIDAIVAFLLGSWCAQLYINYNMRQEIKALYAGKSNDLS